MLQHKISHFAKKCGVSNSINKRATYIFGLLEKVSSGLDNNKHAYLLRSIQEKISDNDQAIIESKIISNFKKWSLSDLSKVMKYIGTYFYLLNQVELNEIIKINKNREKTSTKKNPKVDSISFSIKKLKAESKDIREVKKIISNISIHPTFTAHPTETRRQSIINKQKKIVKVIDRILNEELNEKEKFRLESKVIRLCNLIMLTDDVRSHKISIKDEIKNTINNSINSLWFAVPELVFDIESSIKEYFGEKIKVLQFLKFHSWVGGDRDGNPNVTSKMTAYAIKKQKQIIISKYLKDLDSLFDDMSVTIKKPIEDSELSKSIIEDLKVIDLSKEILNQYRFEPIRLKIYCIRKKLIKLNQDLLSDEKIEYMSGDFCQDLKTISYFLNQITNNDLLVTGTLRKLIIRSEVFGLNFLCLDIRQHSGVHENVICEVIKKMNLKINYSQLSESEKNDLLVKLVKSNVKFHISKHPDCSSELIELFETFKLIKDTFEEDNNIISSYIISMTHSKSDVFEVLFLGYLTGLVTIKNGKIKTNLNIVPLYETITDLNKAPKLLKELIEDELYMSHLLNKNRFQEIMLGYSDSNKDGGFGMANYSLNECQKKIANLMHSKNINFRFFHGRGGSISRGGGKSNKAILSLPDICQNGKIRFTEQGEVINYRYGSSYIAKRHLEQIISAQIITQIKTKSLRNPSHHLFKKILKQSHDVYKNKIMSKECWRFLINATPIHHISKIPITSRPASRKKINKNKVGFNDLRAIPWVFSWTQVRYNISGWFGMGSALSAVLEEDDGLRNLKNLYHKTKFFKQLLDNMSFEMARSRLEISSLYANTKSEKQFHQVVQNEYELCFNAYKKITGYQILLERNKVISSLINFRNPITDLLSYVQVELLNRHKKHIDRGVDLDNAIFMSINHIAAAMQTTG